MLVFSSPLSPGVAVLQRVYLALLGFHNEAGGAEGFLLPLHLHWRRFPFNEETGREMSPPLSQGLPFLSLGAMQKPCVIFPARGSQPVAPLPSSSSPIWTYSYAGISSYQVISTDFLGAKGGRACKPCLRHFPPL